MFTRSLWFAFGLLLLAPALVGLSAENDPYGDPLPPGAKARLGTARMRISVGSAPLLTPDGKSLYAQTNSGPTLLDPATGVVRGKQPGLFYTIPEVFSADGKRAVQNNFDGVTVWETGSGKALAKIERPVPRTDFAALSADGTVLAIGGLGDRSKKEPVTVFVWDVTGDKEIKKITVPQSDSAHVALSGDGKTLAAWGSHSPDPGAKGPPDPETDPARLVTFWDAVGGKALAKYRVAGYTPGTVVFSPNGAVAAVATDNGSIDLVDPKTGVSKHLLLGRSRMGRSIAFSPDGATLVATADDGAVQRWKVADGVRLSTTEPPTTGLENPRVRALDAEKAIAWAGKGGTAVVWEVPSGKLLSPAGGHGHSVRGVAVTPDGKHVLTSAESEAPLKWELATGKTAGAAPLRLPNSASSAYGGVVIFSPDATRALAHDWSGGLGVYDLATGTQQYVIPLSPEGIPNATFSPDGSKVIVASSSYDIKKFSARVTLWDVAAAKKIKTIELPGFGTMSAALTRDGKLLVTAAHKPAATGGGTFVVTAWEVATGAKKGEFSEEAGFAVPLVATAVDNKTAVVVTPKGQLIAFDLATGKAGKSYDLNRRVPVVAPVFSPDGTKVALVCSGNFGPPRVAPVLVMDWPSGEIKSTFSVPGDAPGAVAFSPDGKWLVTGSPDTTATVWDLSK